MEEKQPQPRMDSMKHTSLEDYAELDMDREKRCGFPEFIYGEGKTAEQLLGIMRRLHESGKTVLATRVNAEAVPSLLTAFPEAEHDALAATVRIVRPSPKKRGRVCVICAGTSDLPMAREAFLTVDSCGYECELIPDCGVAGLHRLISKLERLRTADVVIAAAGMEGALPSVAAGLLSCPVIALPTRVGYGASLGGITALLAMLNSCASGVTVVNIDNGFGAACAAVRILSRLPENQ